MTAILPILLVGCGGGESSSSDGAYVSSQDNLNNGTKYYLVDYSTDDIRDDSLSMVYFEIFNNKFKEYGASKELGEYVLTANNLYYPYENAVNTVTLNSLTSWTSTYIGDVKTEIKLEKVSLSGRNIFDTVLPGYRTLGFDNKNSYAEARKFLNAYGNQKFPQGSNCYRFVSKKQNQPYFSFAANLNNQINQSFSAFNAENQGYVDYLNQKFKPIGATYRYASGQWKNIPWTTIYETDTGIADDESVAVQFENKTYRAEYSSDIEWTAGKEISQWQNLLGRTTTEQERVFKLKIEKLKNGCSIYNETAAKALASLTLLRWNK